MNEHPLQNVFAPLLLLALAALGNPLGAQEPSPFASPGWRPAQTSPFDVELQPIGPNGLQPAPPPAPHPGDDFVLLSESHPPVHEGRQPMILEGELALLPSAHFLKMAKPLSIMNLLAYKRGCDYHHGHETTYGDVLKGWTLESVAAVRGFKFGDPNAGFVAHNREQNTICIVLHGSINNADWITNVASAVVPIPEYHLDKGVPLALEGGAHRGFLAKYLSCRDEIMGKVDGLLNTLTVEEQEQTLFYVSGHSQAAALGQLLVADLCQHLRKRFGPAFDNARDNQVYAWLLSAPLALDQEGVACVEKLVGKANIVVQNTWLDLVPNVGLTAKGFEYRPIGTPIMQSSLAASLKVDQAHQQAVRTHVANGDLTSALWGSLMDPLALGKLTMAGQHMGTDNVNYRGVGSDYGFDPDMVVTTEEGLRKGLMEAFQQRQNRLQGKTPLLGSISGYLQ